MTPAFPKPEPRVRERKRLRTKTQLRAKRWGIKARSPRRLDRPGSEPAFLAWVRTERCCVGSRSCSGRIEAHHAGKNPGVGLKAPDNTAVPLCQHHHRQITDHSGMFKGLGREALRVLQDRWVGETYARYLSAGGRRAA